MDEKDKKIKLKTELAGKNGAQKERKGSGSLKEEEGKGEGEFFKRNKKTRGNRRREGRRGRRGRRETCSKVRRRGEILVMEMMVWRELMREEMQAQWRMIKEEWGEM